MDILNRHILLLPAVLLGLTGCYTEFEPDIDSPSVLCLNSMITAGEPVAVSVTHTWRYSSGYGDVYDDMAVPDASVSLFVNGAHVGDMTYVTGDRKFHSSYTPAPGDTVELRANAPVYGAAEAMVVVPVPTPVDSVEWAASAYGFWYDEYGQDGFSAQFSVTLDMKTFITDASGSDNYFKINWSTYTPVLDEYFDRYVYPQVRFWLGDFDYEAEPLFSEHVGVMESVLGSDSYGFTAFSDRQFSGRTYPLRLRFATGSYSVTAPRFDDALCDVKVELKLESISQGYYNWLIYDWQDSDGIIGSLGDVGFAEGLVGYSNVSTGAGVVAARATSSYVISLGEFIKKQIEQIKS